MRICCEKHPWLAPLVVLILNLLMTISNKSNSLWRRSPKSYSFVWYSSFRLGSPP